MPKRSGSYAPKAPAKRYKKASTYTPSVAKQVKRIVDGTQELKAHDTVVIGTAVGNALGLYFAGAVFNIVQGTGDDQRVGRKVRVKKIHWKGMAENDAVTSGIHQFYIIHDSQPNGALPVIGDIFSNSAPGATFLNLDNSHRFRILKSQVVVHPDKATTNLSQLPFEMHVECDIPIFFDGTAGAIGDLTTGNILFVCGQNVSGTTTEAEINGQVRVRYLDG